MNRKAVPLMAIIAILMIAASPLIGPAVSESQTAYPPAVTVVSVNTISGTVNDMNGKGIPNANVTLYYTSWTGAEYKAKDVFKTNNNPQFTGDGRTSPSGLYVFTDIPEDVYALTAEKDGVSVSKLVNVRGGKKTQNLTIDGYIEKDTTPLPSITYGPTPGTATAQKLDVGAIILEVLKVALMGVVGVQFIVSIAIVVLRVRPRN